MDLPQLTPELEQAVRRALTFAQNHRHEWVSTEHLFWAILHDPLSARAIQFCGGNLKDLKEQVIDFIEKNTQSVPENFPCNPQLTQGVEQIIREALTQATRSQYSRINGVHFLIAYYQLKDCYSVYLLRQQGIEVVDLMRFCSKIDGSSRGQRRDESSTDDSVDESVDDSVDDSSEDWLEDEDDEEEDSESSSEHFESTEDSEDSEEYPRAQKGRKGAKAGILARFAVCLNREAKAGKIDPMIGRTAELERTIHVLCRRRKNNPVFVGEAGVGKTAIAEGLARAIVLGEVPDPIKDAEIYSLDVGSLLAGTRYRGDFEERLKGVLKEITKNPKAILFIDEIHNIIGAGSTNGDSMDAAMILKPLLARGNFRCMGATTWDEFNRIFEKDRALARRFQKIDINEPTIEDSIAILKGVSSAYADFHHVTYSPDAISEAVRLSARHLQDRRLPDKAIDVIDEAGAAAHLAGRDRVEQQDIETTIARMAQIPPRQLEADDKQKLSNLEEDLKAVVFGQDEAIKALSTAVKVARAGLADPNRPDGCFLFTGPTGVGKTELAKQLAAVLGMNFVRFDMSEYSESHTVSRLIGSPPGYVGFERGGLLTDAVIKTPHSVILLDEIEKAHNSIYNLLLQVMDNGTLTDATGKQANFRNVILIMSSNIGARDYDKRRPGFLADLQIPPGEDDHEYKRNFSPEFRNRLDARIRFAPLSTETMGLIVDKFIKALNQSLESQKAHLEISEEARALLVKRGFDPKFGARPMARLIADEVKKPLADELLFGRLAQGGQVRLKVLDEKFTFDFILPDPADPATDDKGVK